MTKYFFQVSGAVSFTDREGQELSNDEEAWSLGVTSIGELLRDLDGKLPKQAEIQSTVTTEAGAVLFTLCLTSDKRPSQQLVDPVRPEDDGAVNLNGA